MGAEAGRKLERATPGVILVLGALWLGLTLFLATDTGRSAAAERPTAAALAGRQVWLSHNCSVCHQIYGLGGFLGPDLTNEFSARGPELIAGVLRSGYGAMPRVALSDAEVAALGEYLRYVDTTGRFPQKTWPLEGLPN